MSHRRAAVVLALLAMLAVLASACSGVPESSAPHAVESIGVGGVDANPPILPPRNAYPYEIVADFLDANSADPSTGSAQTFLTSAQRSAWADTSATVLSNERISTYDERAHTITVSGNTVGTLNSNGVYLPGTGQAVSFPFALTQVHGQYRISQLKKGLVLTTDQFTSDFHAHSLYFPDAAERYLVPDLRYSALIDSHQIANWLLGQLVAGPSNDLQNNVVSTDTLPAQATRVTASLGATTTVQVAGAAQLSRTLRNLLAAQLSETLNDVVRGGEMAILDGAHAVVVPRVDGTRFTASDFVAQLGPTAPAEKVYYLDDGKVYEDGGDTVAGPFGDGAYPLDSVAVTDENGADQLTLAGVQRFDRTHRLVVGNQSGPVRATTVTGRLSRPAWAPGRPEVWVGSGSQIYAVTVSARAEHAAKVTVSSPPGGRVAAIRFSPDGERVAIVITGANGSGQVYVGMVVRATGTPQVASLHAISPAGVVVTDVAWSDSLKLFAIGYQSGSTQGVVYDCNVDGARWADSGSGSPPGGRPDTLTMTTDAPAWVSAGPYVWVQNSGTWVSPIYIDSGQTPGAAPVYLE